MPPSFQFRLPSSFPTSTTTSSPTPTPPTLQWLTGPWNVTHSTLPMWKSSRNVRITYTPIAGTSPAHIDDVVSYQALSSEAIKTIRGVDKPFDVRGGRDKKDNGNDNNNDNNNNNTGLASDNSADDDAGTQARASLGYNWRGKGWLMIASSQWEILGYGDEEGGGSSNSWVVTYFAKTLFTPAGVDFYSRKGALKPETLESIKAGLEMLGGEIGKLAREIFEVKMDDAGSDGGKR